MSEIFNQTKATKIASKMTPPLLALEEHFYSNAIFNSIGETFRQTLQGVPGLSHQLKDFGDARIDAMDQGNISFQVVSHAFTPGSYPLIPSCQSYLLNYTWTCTCTS